MTLRGNTSQEDRGGYRIENTTRTRLTGNLVSAVVNGGIDVLGGNAELEMADNLITGGTVFSDGPLFSTPSAQVPVRSTGVVVHDITVAGIKTTNTAGAVVGTGVGIGIGAINGARFFDNALSGNGAGQPASR